MPFTGHQLVTTGTGQTGNLSVDLNPGLDVSGLCVVQWTVWTEVVDILLFPTLSAHLDFVAENSSAITVDDTFTILALGELGSVGGQFICQQKAAEALTLRFVEDTASLTAKYGWRVTVHAYQVT